MRRLVDHPEDRRIDSGIILGLRPRPQLRPRACVLCLDDLVIDPPALVLPVGPGSSSHVFLSGCPASQIEFEADDVCQSV